MSAFLDVQTRSIFRPRFSLNRVPDWCLAGVLAGAILFAYLPALQGSFLWDDQAHVTRPDLRSLHGLERIWFDVGATQQYYPLLHSAFWFEHKLWGDASVGYHLVTVLFHILAACLVLVILRRLKVPGAFLAAAIFALHPVNVESVAWIAEQKNTLSAVFYLGAMLAYLRFDQERQGTTYVVALGLFVLGLMTKPVVATLPAALLVIFWWQRGALGWRRDVWPLSPWFVLGGAAGLFMAWVERKVIGAQGAAYELNLLERLLLAARVIWFYLGKLLWPADLMFVYPRWEVNPTIWWQYLFVLGAVALGLLLWFIRHRWRGPLAGFLFFVGTLFPAMGFANVYFFRYSFVADHFQYLASLGVIVVASSGIALLLEVVPRRASWAGPALCIALVGTLAALTWQQSRMYGDPLILYRATLERNPSCWMCHNNLGILLRAAGRRWEAIPHYEAALRLRPDDAVAHNNLGNVLAQEQAFPLAMAHFEEALRLQPNFAEAHNNLGNTLLREGRLSEAVSQYEDALRLKPGFADAHNGLGRALFLMGRTAEAKEHFNAALRINPNHVLARRNRALLEFSADKAESKK